MSKRRKKDARRKPDETFQAGPFAFARYGKMILSKNLASPKDMQAVYSRMAASYDSVVTNIDEATVAIGDLVARYDPLELLKRAYWTDVTKLMGLESEVEMGTEEAHAQRMLDYLHAVIVSYPPSPDGYLDPTDAVWEELSSKIRELFSLINHSYPYASWAKRKLGQSDFDQNYEDFAFKAQLYWVNIRGDRYISHDLAHLRDALAPHNDVFKELFGVSTAEVVSGYEALQNSLLRGPFEAIYKIHEIEAQVWPQVKQRLEGRESDSDIRRLVSLEVENRGLRDPLNMAMEQAFLLGLFDVEAITKLPKSLLSELAYKPGEDQTFFALGPARGWPTKVWPNWVRPFIAVGGRIYCFDIYSVKDRFYRVLQRLVCRLRPQYQETWNVRQKGMSEALPLQLLTRILPGGEAYKEVYYKFKLPGKTESARYESDGVFIYDDVLVVVEVKAGAFALAPPTSNLENYISSLKDLLVQPAKQGTRFLQYLRSAKEVSIFDKEHREIARLKAGNFRMCVACAVTLDGLTELAGRSGHLRNIGVDIGTEPVWTVSIDDLRVYADIFVDPLKFLHFLQERIKAVQAPGVDLEDELDHLGLYIAHNHYVKHANKISEGGNVHMQWLGFREDIDKYYHRLMAAPGEAVRPTQDLPPRLEEIVSILNVQRKPKRTEVASSLLDMSGEARRGFCELIEQCITEQARKGKPQPVSMHGEAKLTIFCWQPRLFRIDPTLAQEHTRIVMLLNMEAERLLLELTLDDSGRISDVSWQKVTLIGLSEQYLSELRTKSEGMRRNRVARHSAKTKPNDPCPCGSGRKFKRCCGTRT